MKVKAINIFLLTAVMSIVIPASLALGADLPQYSPDYYNSFCPEGQEALLDEAGFPLLNEDCETKLVGRVITGPGALGTDPDGGVTIELEEPPPWIECIICQQTSEFIPEQTAQQTVQQDAYTAASAVQTGRTTMPSTGMATLVAVAGLVTTGIGIKLYRRQK